VRKVYVYTDARRMNVTHVDMHCSPMPVLDLSQGGWSLRERIVEGGGGWLQSARYQKCVFLLRKESTGQKISGAESLT
jgi:hypothetical protein